MQRVETSIRITTLDKRHWAENEETATGRHGPTGRVIGLAAICLGKRASALPHWTRAGADMPPSGTVRTAPTGGQRRARQRSPRREEVPEPLRGELKLAKAAVGEGGSVGTERRIANLASFVGVTSFSLSWSAFSLERWKGPHCKTDSVCTGRRNPDSCHPEHIAHGSKRRNQRL
jgi:hypothetical protein